VGLTVGHSRSYEKEHAFFGHSLRDASANVSGNAGRLRRAASGRVAKQWNPEKPGGWVGGAWRLQAARPTNRQRAGDGASNWPAARWRWVAMSGMDNREGWEPRARLGTLGFRGIAWKLWGEAWVATGKSGGSLGGPTDCEKRFRRQACGRHMRPLAGCTWRRHMTRFSISYDPHAVHI
jgi:hypothetical protein